MLLWCGLVSLKIVLIFLQNFLNFRFNTIEKQSIINLSHSRSKSYAFVVLGDFEVTFLRDGKDVALSPSLYCILFIYFIVKWESSNSLIFHTSWGYFIKACSFSAFNFCQYYAEFFLGKLSYFDVYLVINYFHRFICDFRGVFKQILEMFFSHLYSFIFVSGLKNIKTE